LAATRWQPAAIDPCQRAGNLARTGTLARPAPDAEITVGLRSGQASDGFGDLVQDSLEAFRLLGSSQICRSNRWSRTSNGVARFEILIKRSAAQEIEAISRKKDRQRIVRRIVQLAEDPQPPGCQKFSGRDRYRIRQGPYRIVYSIEDDRLIVFVVKVGKRSEVYRGSL